MCNRVTDLTKRQYGHRDAIQSSTESSTLARPHGDTAADPERVDWLWALSEKLEFGL